MGDIAFFSLSYMPTYGGTERQVQSLAEQWTKTGKTVWVLTLHSGSLPTQEIINGVHVVRFKTIPIKGLSWLHLGIQMKRFFSEHQDSIEALIVQMFNTAAIVCAWSAQKAKIPMLVRASAGGRYGNLDKIQRTLFGPQKAEYIIKRIKAVVAVNEEIKSEFSQLGASVISIPNGVNTHNFKPADHTNKEKLRHKYGFSSEEYLFLYAGRLEKVKNLKFFIKSFSKISQQHAHAKFLIAGDGPEEQNLKGMNVKNVVFLGKQTDLLPHYQLADNFILPSYREGISNALIEAMASGLVPIASDIPGNQAVITSGENGFLCGTKDSEAWVACMTSFINSPDKKITMGKNVLETIRSRFSTTVVQKSYQDFLADLHS